MHINSGQSSSTGFPPIVLLAQDDPDTLEIYSSCLESAGMWVAKATGPHDALSTAIELRPDVVVTNLAVENAGSNQLIHALEAQPETLGIPVLVLSGETPIRPEALLGEVRQWLERSRELRRRSDAVTSRAAALRERSSELLAQSQALAGVAGSSDRPCPECRRPLRWTERGRIGGVEYDYFRWCAQGCGLFVMDRAAGCWVKLA